MNLTYRGNAYTVPTSVHSSSDCENQPKQKLIYRGQMYNYAPPAAEVPKAFAPNELTVTLIYRGVTFERQICSPKPAQTPHAIMPGLWSASDRLSQGLFDEMGRSPAR